jgi:hypothetical protein
MNEEAKPKKDLIELLDEIERLRAELDTAQKERDDAERKTEARIVAHLRRCAHRWGARALHDEAEAIERGEHWKHKHLATEIAWHRSGLCVHLGADGRCVVVEWSEMSRQYQTARERAHIESPSGSVRCGSSPWNISARPLRRDYAIHLFHRYKKAREEAHTASRPGEPSDPTAQKEVEAAGLR